MLKVLITGAGGQLGQALARSSLAAACDCTFVGRSDLDIADPDAVDLYFAGHAVDAVINCAAYTDVERAESEPDAAMRINARAVGILAGAAHRAGAGLIHISTDFVFGGERQRSTPYTETDTPAPLNAYGRSKLAGEREAMRHGSAVILRTSWLYSPWGRNFFRTILDLAGSSEMLRVVDDQTGTPTYAPDLAETIAAAADSRLWQTAPGIYHYSDEGACTWFDFAARIVGRTGPDTCRIEPCTSAQRPTAALRPSYSVLDKSLIKRVAGIGIPRWEESLDRCLDYMARQTETP